MPHRKKPLPEKQRLAEREKCYERDEDVVKQIVNIIKQNRLQMELKAVEHHATIYRYESEKFDTAFELRTYVNAKKEITHAFITKDKTRKHKPETFFARNDVVKELQTFQSNFYEEARNANRQAVIKKVMAFKPQQDNPT